MGSFIPLFTLGRSLATKAVSELLEQNKLPDQFVKGNLILERWHNYGRR